jgi:hypothetical protein
MTTTTPQLNASERTARMKEMQMQEIERSLQQEKDKQFSPPDIEVSIAIMLIASIVLLITIQQELILASVTYFPSVTLATLCTWLSRLALLAPEQYQLRVRCFCSLISQCVLTTSMLACVSAISCHWFCFLRIFPGHDRLNQDSMCANSSIDFWLLPIAFIFSGYTFLHLLFAIRLRSIIEPSSIAGRYV